MPYKTPPDQEIFDDIKENAIKILRGFKGNQAKINHINLLQNKNDYAWYIVSLLNPQQRIDLAKLITEETAKQIEIAYTEHYI